MSEEKMNEDKECACCHSEKKTLAQKVTGFIEVAVIIILVAWAFGFFQTLGLATAMDVLGLK